MNHGVCLKWDLLKIIQGQSELRSIMSPVTISLVCRCDNLSRFMEPDQVYQRIDRRVKRHGNLRPLWYGLVVGSKS